MRVHKVQVLRRVPHAGRGFTQGLIMEPAEDGGAGSGAGPAGGAGYTVLESSGLYGLSALRRYRLGADAPEASASLPAEFFGEGICRVGDSVWQLTWRERQALRWDAEALALREAIRYNREGWGICAIGEGPRAEVITSDGTSELVRRDPETLEPREIVKVRCQGYRVRGLNDLAWAAGKVWANVAPTAALVGIDLTTGMVTDVVDASRAAERQRGDPQAIMNGIAALPGRASLPGAAEPEFLLTGKRWQSIRQVRLVPTRSRVALDWVLAGAAG